MFNNLVESDSHKEELARKSRFFLGALAFYALLFAVGGVASIYAYDAHMENQNLEIVTLLPPVEPATAVEETPRNIRAASQRPASDPPAVDRRTALIASTDRPLAPGTVNDRGSAITPVRNGVLTIPGNVNSDAVGVTGPIGPGTGEGTNAVGPHLPSGPMMKIETEPPPDMPRPAPTRAPQHVVISLGVINGKMLNKPNLSYPPLAKATGTQGAVAVQVLIDESGKVISAKAMSGPAMLRAAAEQAAYQARFSSTMLSNQPVRVSGTITFNFQLQ